MIALYLLAGLIVLFLLVAAFVGTGWRFEKSVLIQASRASVWDHVNTLAAMNTWNPWLDRDPNLHQEMSGTDGTPGATYAWDSPVKNVGAGRQTIVSVTAPIELTSRIQFIRPFKGLGIGYIRLEEERGFTRAAWGIESSTPYPMNIIKLFGVIEKNMDRDFGKGLKKLKEICEK
jgi:hypothetical protein